MVNEILKKDNILLVWLPIWEYSYCKTLNSYKIHLLATMLPCNVLKEDYTIERNIKKNYYD